MTLHMLWIDKCTKVPTLRSISIFTLTYMGRYRYMNPCVWAQTEFLAGVFTAPGQGQLLATKRHSNLLRTSYNSLEIREINAISCLQ